jgi:hypothetical protein
MPTIAGVAAEILLGDTKPKVLEARAEGDPRTIQIIQQCVAIAGHNFNKGRGKWTVRTPDQQKFAEYDLDSYDEGKLDFAIGPRPFIPEPPLTVKERWELVSTIYPSLQIDLAYLLEKIVSLDEEEIKKMKLPDNSALAAMMGGADTTAMLTQMASRSNTQGQGQGQPIRQLNSATAAQNVKKAS